MSVFVDPVAMAIIVNTFTDRRQRAKAVGVWGSVVGVSLAAGPVIGGILVSALSWRAVFWINIPIGVAVILLTQRYVPESKAPRARGFDPAAQALMVVLLGSLTYAVIEGPNRGWQSPLILSALRARLLTIPMAAMIAIFGSVSGRLVASRGARPPFLIAGPALAIGALMLARLTASTSLGVAVTGSLIATSVGAGFVSASHAAWLVIAGLGIAVLLVGLISTGQRALDAAAQRHPTRPARGRER